MASVIRRAASAAASTVIIFLGPPGVGKGTYASRIAAAAGGVHIAAGDLVREEITRGSPLGMEMRKITAAGQLLDDEIIVDLIAARVAEESATENRLAAVAGDHDEKQGEERNRGDSGPAAIPQHHQLHQQPFWRQRRPERQREWPLIVLDGVPRTAAQAEMLEARGVVPPTKTEGTTQMVRVVNLRMREEALIAKLLARRSCSECGRGYNVADIDLPEDTTRGLPEVRLIPMNPPEKCVHKMTAREDDTEDVIRERLRIHQQESAAVEDFYRSRGVVVDFEIQYGIPETTPSLEDLSFRGLQL